MSEEVSTFAGSLAGVYGNYSMVKEITIPPEQTEIKPYEFQEYTELRVVHTHPNITKVGVGAFKNCRKLESVFLGESVKEMGSSVFDNCPRVVLDTHYGSIPYEKREGHRFQLRLKEGVPINDYPVCELLEFTSIQNALDEAGVKDKLHTLISLFGEKTSGVPSTKLAAIKALKHATLEFAIEDGVLVAYNGNAEVVTVPTGVRAIGQLAFYKHLNIREIHLPATLEGFDPGGEEESEWEHETALATFGCLPNLECIVCQGADGFIDLDGILYSSYEDDLYCLCVPAKHRESAGYNKFLPATDALKSWQVVEALNVLGIEDKEAAVKERIGEMTTLCYSDMIALLYGKDLKPLADAKLSDAVDARGEKKSEASKKQATPEQKAARALLFGKKGKR